MNDFCYNDNEIIYLIRLGNEYAYDFINAKYKRFIYSKIKKFNFIDEDDYYQEGLIALYNAIITYNEAYDKTFNKYFEKVLVNRFLCLKRKSDYLYGIISMEVIDNQKFILKEDSRYKDDKVIEVTKFTTHLSERDKLIFDMLYIERISVLEISNRLDIKPTNLYKIIYKIKQKIKKNMIQ